MKTKIEKQIIISESGNTWLGFYSLNKVLQDKLKEIGEIVARDLPSKQLINRFWVFDMEFTCVAAQSTLEGALKYWNEDRILIHNQRTFV